LPKLISEENPAEVENLAKRFGTTPEIIREIIRNYVRNRARYINIETEHHKNKYEQNLAEVNLEFVQKVLSALDLWCCEDTNLDTLKSKLSDPSIGNSSEEIRRMPQNTESISTKALRLKSKKENSFAANSFSTQLNRSKGGGASLSTSTNGFMSQAFGNDFSNVRVHTDSNAVQMNQGLNARAFTHGSNIYFNKGEYQPESSDGKRLLAHELTHVVQQEEGGIKKNTQKKQFNQKISPVRNMSLPIQRTAGEDLIASHTSFLNLDEDRLGRTLYQRALRRQFSLIGSVFDELGSTDRDDVALGFMRNSNDSGLLRIARGAQGRRLLDRMYDELTSGSADQEEMQQADRILRIKSQQIPSSDFPQNVGQVKIFPFHSGWANNTVYRVTRRSDGDIHVRMSALSWADYHNQMSNIPERIATSGIILRENEIIGIKQIDEGGGIIYRPSLIMVQLQNQSVSDAINNAITAASIGLTLGSGALVGSAARGAGWLARAAVWGERAALAIDVLTNIIREHRGWIIRTFGQNGRRFVYFNELLSSAAALYGMATVVVSMGRLVTNFRRAFTNWRSMARQRRLSGSQGQIVNQISQQGDGILDNVDQIRTSRNQTQGGRTADSSGTPQSPDAQGRSARSTADPEIDQDVERAFREDAQFDTGEMRSRGRMRRPGSDELVPSFDSLNLTRAQRQAMRRISGQRLSQAFQDAWQHVIDNNSRAQREITEIRRLFDAGDVQGARTLARQVYNRARSRFWRYIRGANGRSLRRELEAAGLQFSGSRGSAPYWEFPDGFRERLTLEHTNRVTDAPWRAVEADNFQFVPFRENVNTLEWIRRLPEFH